MTYPSYKLLLVDNASTDGTVKAVIDRFSNVEIIVNSRNLGFAGGFNVGIKHALSQGADFVLIINNDTVVEKSMLDELVGYSDVPDVGILAPKIYFADEPERIWSVGGLRNPLTLEMTHKGDCQLDRGQWDDVIERDYLVGCALLLRRSMLDDIGLFDVGYQPAYYEDMDLCLRARSCGYRLLMVPKAQIWHKVAASGGGVGSKQERYYMARNSVRFFKKHVRGWRWFAVVPFRLGSAFRTTIRLVSCNRPQAALAYWRGLWDGVTTPVSY